MGRLAEESQPLYLSIAQAAQYAGIGEHAMRAFADSSDPPPILRIGRKRYIERAGLAAYLRSKQETPAPVHGNATRYMRSA